MLLLSLSNSLVLLVCASIVSTQDINITISLNKTTTFTEKQLYGDFITLNRTSTLQVNFENIRADLGFIIIQVHSHLYNITLYNNGTGDKATGTNLGLYTTNVTLENDIFFVKNLNPVIDLKVYVAVHGYILSDPIPGGCEMVAMFPSVYIPPFLKSTYDRNYILVDAAPAQYYDDLECYLSDKIELQFYMLYLPEQNYNSDVYFEGIKSMMSLNNILKNGRLIPETGWNTRRILNAYTGTGAVYVTVAFARSDFAPYNYTYAAYVPAISYGCDPSVDGDCELLDDSLSQFMCAGLFFVGLFMCYFGHRFFKTHTFFIGFLSGLVVTCVLISLFRKDFDRPAILALAALSGLCVGASRLVFWWIYGLPVFSIILSSADVGFLLTSLAFYGISDELSKSLYLYLDVNFWSLFIIIITLVTIALLAINFIANPICCAIIGAYATILPIDYYVGSQMKYIIINIVRRATLKDYHKAVRMPTFQWKDWLLVFLWLGLSTTGFIYQYYQNKGRPPFPPPPRSVRAVPEEAAPIAGPSGYRRSLNNEGGVRSLPYYFNERTPLLA